MYNKKWDEMVCMQGGSYTMYDFHNSTDTLKFWTENGLLIKLFCFSSDFDETWWNCSTHRVRQHHKVLLNSTKKQKRFIYNKFKVCSVH